MGSQSQTQLKRLSSSNRPWEFLFQYPIILLFHTVHGVLKARILKWFAIPFSSGPHSVRNIWKTQQWPQNWKRSVFIPIPKKGNAKECSNYHTTALISHANKVMLKILQVRLQQKVNRELPDVQAGFRKGRGTRDQIVNIC